MFKDLKKVKIQNIFTETDKAPGFGLVALFKRLLKYLNVSYVDTCCNETYIGEAGVPTWQQTLTRSSELTEEVVITGAEPFQINTTNSIFINNSDALGEHSASIEMYPDSGTNHIQLFISDANTGNDRYLRIHPNNGFTFGYDGGNEGFTIPGNTSPEEGEIMVCGVGETFYFANPALLSKPILYITANYNVDHLADYTIVSTANSPTVTLPEIATYPELEGRIFKFKCLSGLGQKLYVEATSGEFIDLTLASVELNNLESLTVQGTNIGWIVI